MLLLVVYVRAAAKRPALISNADKNTGRAGTAYLKGMAQVLAGFSATLSFMREPL